MRAFYITAPGETAFGEIDPPVPARDEVLLQVDRVGLCGSDLNTFRGRNALVTYPRIPGHEIAGTILELGADVPAEFSVGQRVSLVPYYNCGTCIACEVGRTNACLNNQTLGVQREGALTEQIVVPHRQLLATKLVDPADFAIIEPLAVGFHATSRAQVTERDTVVVFGCGAIGLGVVAGCVARGARVIAVDIDDGKLDLARQVGAAETINSMVMEVEPKVHDLTDGRGANVAIEAVGLPQTFVAAVNVVGPLGRVVYVGYPPEPVSFQTKYFLMKELDIRGSRGALREDFEAVVEYLEGGRYPVEASTTKVFPFDQTGQALREWDDNPALVTKFMIDVGPVA
ncbi:MAG: zinc-binding alcohol dehydrogenase family protein [Sphingomonadales bacterium]|nr:zinc-binding alcohol dehydrogenase family protein [Sphingomonadales bacterium]